MPILGQTDKQNVNINMNINNLARDKVQHIKDVVQRQGVIMRVRTDLTYLYTRFVSTRHSDYDESTAKLYQQTGGGGTVMRRRQQPRAIFSILDNMKVPRGVSTALERKNSQIPHK